MLSTHKGTVFCGTLIVTTHNYCLPGFVLLNSFVFLAAPVEFAVSVCDDTKQSIIVVTDDGAVYSWGYNSNGSLGLQNSRSSVVTPSPMQNCLEGVRITHVSCGCQFSLALSDNGEVM